MPTYSYKCTNCGNAFDIVQSFSDDALTTCDVCGSPLRKVFSPVGVTFNGSGFYRTDSRSTASKGASTAKSDSGSSSSAPASSGSSSSSSSSSSGSSGTSGTSGSSGSSSGGSSSGGSPSSGA